VAGAHAERALDLALAAVDHALDDDLGGPGDVEAGERGGGDRGGGTAQCAGHLVLALVVRHRHACDDRHRRVVAEGDGDGQVLAPLLGLAQVEGDVVHGDRLHGEPVPADDLEAVGADVLLAVRTRTGETPAAFRARYRNAPG
jgi:hypothetical protein